MRRRGKEKYQRRVRARARTFCTHFGFRSLSATGRTRVNGKITGNGTLTVQCRGNTSRTGYIGFGRPRPAPRRPRPRPRPRRWNPTSSATRQLKQQNATAHVSTNGSDDLRAQRSQRSRVLSDRRCERPIARKVSENIMCCGQPPDVRQVLCAPRVIGYLRAVRS